MKISYYTGLISVSLISLVLHYFLFSKMNLDWNVWIWFLYIYFPVSSLIIYRVLEKQLSGRPQTFVTIFMGAMAGKLFISLILLLFVLYFNPEIKIPFALSFLFLYLLFTTLNTIYIFSKLRQS